MGKSELGMLPELGTQRMLLTDEPLYHGAYSGGRMPCGPVAGPDGARLLREPRCDDTLTGLEVPGH